LKILNVGVTDVFGSVPKHEDVVTGVLPARFLALKRPDPIYFLR
jgi:hypothetical protein